MSKFYLMGLIQCPFLLTYRNVPQKTRIFQKINKIAQKAKMFFEYAMKQYRSISLIYYYYYSQCGHKHPKESYTNNFAMRYRHTLKSLLLTNFSVTKFEISFLKSSDPLYLEHCIFQMKWKDYL